MISIRSISVPVNPRDYRNHYLLQSLNVHQSFNAIQDVIRWRGQESRHHKDGFKERWIRTGDFSLPYMWSHLLVSRVCFRFASIAVDDLQAFNVLIHVLFTTCSWFCPVASVLMSQCSSSSRAVRSTCRRPPPVNNWSFRKFGTVISSISTHNVIIKTMEFVLFL